VGFGPAASGVACEAPRVIVPFPCELVERSPLDAVEAKIAEVLERSLD
jgi:hypothetical protein